MVTFIMLFIAMIFSRSMDSAKVGKVRVAVMDNLKAEAAKQIRERGFTSTKFKIDSNSRDNLFAELCIDEKDHNCYEVSLPSSVKVFIQPGIADCIGAGSGTIVGGAIGGGLGATIGGIVGAVVTGTGIGGGIGAVIGFFILGGTGAAGCGLGGALVGRHVKKNKNGFYISAENIFSQLGEISTSDGKVYATVRIYER